MYLSEEKRSQIREYIENQRSNPEFNSGNDNHYKINHIQEFYDTAGEGKFLRFYLMPGMGKKYLHRFRMGYG